MDILPRVVPIDIRAPNVHYSQYEFCFRVVCPHLCGISNGWLVPISVVRQTLSIPRLWKQLIPETNMVVELLHWRDPAARSDHLGLSSTVALQLYADRRGDIQTVVRRVHQVRT